MEGKRAIHIVSFPSCIREKACVRIPERASKERWVTCQTTDIASPLFQLVDTAPFPSDPIHFILSLL
jgi:hypothetical protein